MIFVPQASSAAFTSFISGTYISISSGWYSERIRFEPRATYRSLHSKYADVVSFLIPYK